MSYALLKAAFEAGYKQGISDERWGGYDSVDEAFKAWVDSRKFNDPCLCTFSQKMVGDGCALCRATDRA